MPFNTSPIFVANRFQRVFRLTNQILSRDGVTGTPLEIVEGSVNGCLIESIRVIPLGDEVANTLRLFEATTTGYRLILEQSLTAQTGTTNTAAVTSNSITLPTIYAPTGANGIGLDPDKALFAALGTASGVNGFNVVVRGGFF